jgi:hypothetical protein
VHGSYLALLSWDAFANHHGLHPLVFTTNFNVNALPLVGPQSGTTH